MKERTTKLAGPANYSLAIDAAAISDPVTVERLESEGNGLLFLDARGRPLGRLTAGHEVAHCLSAGEVVLHCSVNSITKKSTSYPHGAVNVRIVTGLIDEHFEMPPMRSYPLGIVGESHYQASIARCHVGDRVLFAFEPDNPHDSKAIVAKTTDGSTLGYVARDSWLRDALHEEARQVSATILSLYSGPPIAVVLNVVLDGAPVGISRYSALPKADREQKPLRIDANTAGKAVNQPRRGWLMCLFGR